MAPAFGVSFRPWKSAIKQFLQRELHGYSTTFDPSEPVWQHRFYDFNLFTPRKIEEKLDYMHLNPVRAELVRHPWDWPWSSARYYIQGRSVGVPVGWVT